jgi:hypothetical protein
MTDDTVNALVLRGRNIRFDENGLVCLNDIWKVAGFRKNQQPGEWSRLPGTVKKMERVLELVTGKSRDYGTADMRMVYRTVRGRNAATYADIRLALDYAEYLNPKLAIEVKEVFLRYKAGDATLADEVLQKASAEDNVWVAQRAIGRAARIHFTHELRERGVTEPKHYAFCTNATYLSLWDKTAKEIRAEKGIPANVNPRDRMDTKELAFLAASEALSVERMEDEDSQGFNECHKATAKAARAIRSAIEADRRDRQKRMVG